MLVRKDALKKLLRQNLARNHQRNKTSASMLIKRTTTSTTIAQDIKKPHSCRRKSRNCKKKRPVWQKKSKDYKSGFVTRVTRKTGLVVVRI